MIYTTGIVILIHDLLYKYRKRVRFVYVRCRGKIDVAFGGLFTVVVLRENKSFIKQNYVLITAGGGDLFSYYQQRSSAIRCLLTGRILTGFVRFFRIRSI